MKLVLILLLISFNLLAWEHYGDGVFYEDKNLIGLKTDPNNTLTTYFKNENLAPGLYRISYELKSMGINSPIGGYSFWNFFDAGNGTEFVIKDLAGVFDWRHVSYTINVKKGLTFWFRLSVPGSIQIKNLKIDKWQSYEPLKIENLQSLKNEKKIDNEIDFKLTKVFDFNSPENGHDLKISKDINNNGIGEFSSGRFYDFSVKKLKDLKIEEFDILSLNVFNPTLENGTFSFSIKDIDSKDYWSSLNFNQSIIPGWNTIKIDLKDYVGERGSHRFFRKLDFNKLSKIFFSVSFPGDLNRDHLALDNVYLSRLPKLKLIPNVLAFDFTSVQSNRPQFTPVYAYNEYNKELGYGFLEQQFTRVNDAKYVPEFWRYTIGIKSGKFKVDLPNGNYFIKLNINSLGYWDVPFYSDRTVLLNNRPIFKETRNSSIFLSDLLQFENVEPRLNDHPYDLYLNKIFKTIDREVEVKNGELVFDFNGDQSGIELNSLFIIRKDTKTKFDQLSMKLEKQLKDEFALVSSYNPPAINIKSNNISLVEISPDILSFKEKKINENSVRSFLFKGEELRAMIAIESKDKSLLIINNESKNIKISRLVNQYLSRDLNHESFSLSGSFFKPVLDNSLKVEANTKTYLLLTYKNDGSRPGNLISKLSLKMNDLNFSFDIIVKNSNLEPLKLNIPVGFLSLDPLPFSYFNNESYESFRKKYRLMALEKFNEIGMTAISGIPKLENLDDFLSTLTKFPNIKTVFSYGGQFNINENNNDEITHLKTILKKFKDKKIEFIYTYSDEANGYSNKIVDDIKKGSELKRKLPELKIGGFSNFNDQEVKKLNNLFDFGFYSSLKNEDLNYLKKNNLNFGLYGGGASNLSDLRHVFGFALFLAQKNGVRGYLEWNTPGFNNFPYYDLDGRESDVVLFYPTISDGLFESFRFQLLKEGLAINQRLRYLEFLVENKKVSPEIEKEINSLLKLIKTQNYFEANYHFMSQYKYDFEKYKKQIDSLISRIN